MERIPHCTRSRIRQPKTRLCIVESARNVHSYTRQNTPTQSYISVCACVRVCVFVCLCVYVRGRVYVSRVCSDGIHFRTHSHKTSVVLLAQQRSQHTRPQLTRSKNRETICAHVHTNHRACKSKQRPLDRTPCPFAASDAVVATFERRHFLSTSSPSSRRDKVTRPHNPYSFWCQPTFVCVHSIHAQPTASTHTQTHTLTCMRL